jgi:kynurenine 3-monooxygenase
VNRHSPLSIIGAGPTGALLAILLARRGFTDIHLYESRPDPRGLNTESGRSINLALADRGIHALKSAGVFDDLSAALLPMRGRGVHLAGGDYSFQPYGQRAHEVNYSVSRRRLNADLIEIAAGRNGIQFHFEHALESADFAQGTALIRDARAARTVVLNMQPLLATDGAGSVLRRSLSAQGLIHATETDLEHGYKELSIPATSGGGFALAADALHIWPRGKLMLIALPNADGSFTATLFLPKQGEDSFDSLNDGRAIQAFLSQQFPDAYSLMPQCVAEFAAHSVGFLGTVSAAPWFHAGQCALLGDAAHAMVPFHGQGMNCCFEDCLEFDACLDHCASWRQLFAEFGARRKANTDAISAMALENYLEMRARVADPKFQLQQALSLELEKRFPQRFIPRYSMVMFHHEIPYELALRRGRIQSALLSELTAGSAAALADIDFARARDVIEARLAPLDTRHPA